MFGCNHALGETVSGMQEYAQEVHQLQEELAQRSASLLAMTSDSQELKAQLSGLSLNLASVRQDLSQVQAASFQAAQVQPANFQIDTVVHQCVLPNTYKACCLLLLSVPLPPFLHTEIAVSKYMFLHTQIAVSQDILHAQIALSQRVFCIRRLQHHSTCSG